MINKSSNKIINNNNENIKKLREEKEFWKKSYSNILDAYFELHKYRKLYNEQLSELNKFKI